MKYKLALIIVIAILVVIAGLVVYKSNTVSSRSMVTSGISNNTITVTNALGRKSTSTATQNTIT